MTRDETVAFFLECEAKRTEARAAALADGKPEGDPEEIAHQAAKAHWNAWADELLVQRKMLEDGGLWKVSRNYLVHPQKGINAETKAWIESSIADFSFCHFLEKATTGAHEPKEKSERGEQAVKSINIEGDTVRFDGFVFPDEVQFGNATFFSAAWFEGATFMGDAQFEKATFSRNVRFGSVVFSDASFQGATFTGGARFKRATFKGLAWFGSATFEGDTAFWGATFEGVAWFEDATFIADAPFESATFTGGARFGSATFRGEALFEHAAFIGDAWFTRANFLRSAYFASAIFSSGASFRGQTFPNDVFFNGATFGSKGRVDFALATFERVAKFDGAAFEGEADFGAVWGKRTFSLAGARFVCVPDFIQAHFEEAPRLDNVQVEGRLLPPLKESEKLSRRKRLQVWLLPRSRPYRSAHYTYRRVRDGIPKGSALRDMPARWRALKRLAIQGYDTDRELQFFSGEMRSARFAGDWPLPWPIWKANPWAGFLRFWAGLLYQVFSNFGRSLLRPFLAWALCIVIFAAYFLGQSPEMMAKRKDLHRGGVYGQTIAYSTVALDAITQRRPPACLSEETEKNSPDKRLEVDAQGNGFSGLMEQVRRDTNLVNEALSIAYHNAVILLDSSGDSAHRAFGCLYGVERYGGNPVAYVPRSVAIASGIQKLLSAVFIFLFGLAVRNMLKVK